VLQASAPDLKHGRQRGIDMPSLPEICTAHAQYFGGLIADRSHGKNGHLGAGAEV